MFSLKKISRHWYQLLLTHVQPARATPHNGIADISKDLVSLALLAILVIVCFVAEYAYFAIWALAIPLALAGVVMVSAPWIYKKTGSPAIARECFLVSLFLFKLWESVFLASVVSPGTMWFLALPVISILLGSAVSGLLWLVLSTSSVLLLHSHYGNAAVFTKSPVSEPVFLYTFSLIFLGFSLVAFVLMVDASRKKALGRLKDANKVIRELAIRDPLTGIFNRRYLWERMEGEERRALTDAGTFYICLIDLDRFKQINDTLGHPAGDMVLQAVARSIENEIRDEDCFGRYGGEEFILILRSRNTLNPSVFAERIRKCVAELRLVDVPALEKITVSIGIAQFNPGEGFVKTISRADRALYLAKEAGRNRVVFAESSVEIDDSRNTRNTQANETLSSL